MQTISAQYQQTHLHSLIWSYSVRFYLKLSYIDQFADSVNRRANYNDAKANLEQPCLHMSYDHFVIAKRPHCREIRLYKSEDDHHYMQLFLNGQFNV